MSEGAVADRVYERLEEAVRAMYAGIGAPHYEALLGHLRAQGAPVEGSGQAMVEQVAREVDAALAAGRDATRQRVAQMLQAVPYLAAVLDPQTPTTARVWTDIVGRLLSSDELLRRCRDDPALLTSLLSSATLVPLAGPSASAAPSSDAQQGAAQPEVPSTEAARSDAERTREQATTEAEENNERDIEYDGNEQEDNEEEERDEDEEEEEEGGLAWAYFRAVTDVIVELASQRRPTHSASCARADQVAG